MGAFAIVVLVGLWHIVSQLMNGPRRNLADYEQSADNMEEDEDESESGAADFKP